MTPLHAQDEPAAVQRYFWPAVSVLAATLFGLGIILWLAANWDGMGRIGRFALLQGTIAVMCAGAVLVPRMRTPLALLAMLCIGGLFAYFGQTYQTGADPWQLFTVWAVLALPLCLGTRSDVLWAPWALVVSVAISLWTYAHSSHIWRARGEDWPVFFAGWLMAGVLVAALSPLVSRWTGAGTWAMRTAGTLGVVMVTMGGIVGLFKDGPQYVVAVALLAGAGWLLMQRRFFEVFLLSAVALGIDTLLVGKLAWVMFDKGGGDAVGKLLLIGLAAAGILAASVSLIMRMARQHAGAPA